MKYGSVSKFRVIQYFYAEIHYASWFISSYSSNKGRQRSWGYFMCSLILPKQNKKTQGSWSSLLTGFKCQNATDTNRIITRITRIQVYVSYVATLGYADSIIRIFIILNIKRILKKKMFLPLYITACGYESKL